MSRRAVSVLVTMLLLAATPLVAQVTVLEVKTSLVNAEKLQDVCAASGTYDACTRFVAYRLEASCEPTGARWRLNVAARFRPWIFLQSMRQLSHERDHVEDLRRLMSSHLASLESLEFSSRSECEAVTFSERARFGERMLRFALESNLERHPFLQDQGNQLRALLARAADEDRDKDEASSSSPDAIAVSRAAKLRH